MAAADYYRTFSGTVASVVPTTLVAATRRT
jgi:hypothetical protein